MKTSNKLLTGLLIAVFIIPIGMVMAFNQMIKKGDYKVVHNKNYTKTGKTGDYSAVKISVPAFKNTDSRKVLICHLHSAREGHYTFRRFNIMDSISVSNKRDTLFIKYVVKPHPHSTPTYIAYYNIDLYLPDMKNIIVHRATLQMDSIDAAINPEIGVHLTDAVLQLGAGINTNDRHKPLKTVDQLDSNQSVSQYNNLAISAKTSELIFGYRFQVDSLFLAIGKNSKLTIAKDFQADKINGNISDQATIVSNMRTIKKLSGLTTE